ncbi:phosphotransferase [Hymenobacter nivis]|uniref:Aminoglycoside phosphotransferase domain-containing protein n=1 Tax=Hymenobacter nivis TaxID=1850093 RepID=A0A502GZ94_9BACT|nr:phosphotransferase [Hymenobacter nivis]TPG66742.1 hypothetical protein EAH73_10190 [Hymenobacter nivis]
MTSRIISQTLLNSIIHDLESKNEKIIKVEEIFTGVMTYKFELITDSNKSFIARIYPKSIGSTIHYEPDLIRNAHLLGARVPQIIFDSRGKIHTYDFIVYRKILGETLAKSVNTLELKDIISISDNLFNNLSILRKITLNGFGPLVNASQGAFDTWQSFINSSIEEGIKNLANLELSDKDNKKVINYFSENKFIFIEGKKTSNLIWSDISTDNIIIDRNQLSGMIDFDSAMAGEIALEAGYLYAREAKSIFFIAMKRKYDSLGITFDEIKFYSLLRLLRISKYLNTNLPNGAIRENPRAIFPGAFQTINSL